MSPSLSNDASDRDYVVVARRYRPQLFQELIGQEHVAQALGGAISSDRVGHAYLFTGARGVGKTSAARILAKALNCVEGPSPTPCNACEICQSVSSGDDVDVLEIDGASNRGIDEIRQLRQNVAVRPSRARLKIYIIDEVHMLTKEAFNALLKTLEEPPEHVKFIFATTEPNKIPITILSRCQRYDFAGIDAAAIRLRLEQIAQEEGVDVSAEALQIIAMRAAGSMRDSQSLLEQLLSTGARSVSADDVADLLGLAPATRLSQLAHALVQRDAATALSELDQALAQGAEPGQLIDQLLGYFRDAMTQAVGCDENQLLFALPGQLEEVRNVAQQLGVQTLLAISQILDQTAARLRLSTQVRTLTEMAVVRICHLENLDALASLLEQLKSGDIQRPAGRGSATDDQRAARATSTSSAPGPQYPGQRPGPPADEMSLRSAPAGSKLEPTTRRASAGDSPPAANRMTSTERSASASSAADDGPAPEPLDQQSAESIWRQALQSLSGMLADNAGKANVISVDRQGRLAASFPNSQAFSRDACQRPANLAKLEAALAEACGRPLRLTLLTHDDADDAAPQPAPAKTRRQQQIEASNDPLVQKAMQLFEAEPSTLKYVPPADQ